MKSSQYPAQDLRRRALAWAVKLKVNPHVVRVQEMRRKWGWRAAQGVSAKGTRCSMLSVSPQKVPAKLLTLSDA